MATSSFTRDYFIDKSNAEAFANAIEKSMAETEEFNTMTYIKHLSQCLVKLGKKYDRILTENELEIAIIAFEAGYKSF